MTFKSVVVMLLLNTPPPPLLPPLRFPPHVPKVTALMRMVRIVEKKEAAKLKLPIQLWFCGWTNFSPSNLIVKEFL